ncbi:DUF4249 domain-containing protein [Pontibacter sp. MBLB2868]|uniref:DUF4249 domain-containing protein n=1 Tax=Pontibacter sp. MBLB2868 TaxID=3451555 RepID=UPI003F74DB08
MNILKLIPVFLLVGVAILTSCERDADNIKLMDVSSKLAVISYISPQDTIVKVQLQRTQPAIGKELSQEQRKVSNATVTISDGANVATLNYNPDADEYRTAVNMNNVVAGKTYYLTVTTPDGFSASASCSIPAVTNIAITDIATSYVLEPDYTGDELRNYKVALKWKDAPEAKNYYRVLGSFMYKIRDTYGQVHTQVEELYSEHNKSYLYKDDMLENGSITSDKFYFYRNMSNADGSKIKLNILLLVTDRNYYLFQDALHRQQQFDGNPFAEPTILYTNIKGGVGVFAGYNQLIKVQEIE